MVGVRSIKPRHFEIYYHPRFWSTRVLRWFFALIFIILLPIYLYIGFQPAASLDLTSLPELTVADLNLSTPVQPLELTAEHELIAPANLAGSYQQSPNTILIIGHSSTVFQNLHEAAVGDQLTYAGQTYRITHLETLPKSDIKMSRLLAPSAEPTLVLMTCAGQPLPDQDATHRLILTATLITDQK